MLRLCTNVASLQTAGEWVGGCNHGAQELSQLVLTGGSLSDVQTSKHPPMQEVEGTWIQGQGSTLWGPALQFETRST